MKKIPLTTLLFGGFILLILILVFVQPYVGRSKSRQIALELVNKYSIVNGQFSCFPDKQPKRNRRKVFIVEADFTKVSREAREFLSKREFIEVASSHYEYVFRSRDDEVDIYVLIPNPEKYGSPDNKPISMISIEYRENSLIGDLLYDKLHTLCREF